MQLWACRNRGGVSGHQHGSAHRLYADQLALRLLERDHVLLLHSEGYHAIMRPDQQRVRAIVLGFGSALGVRQGEYEDLHHAWVSVDCLVPVIGYGHLHASGPGSGPGSVASLCGFMSKLREHEETLPAQRGEIDVDGSDLRFSEFDACMNARACVYVCSTRSIYRSLRFRSWHFLETAPRKGWVCASRVLVELFLRVTCRPF